MYKLPNANAESLRNGGGSSEAWTAFEGSLGADYAGFSADAYYVKVKDAVSAGALSAAQVLGKPVAGVLGPSPGFSTSNSVAGTISDNETFGVLALYNFGPTVYAGWEHILYENPSVALPAGFNTEGGYVLAYVNNTAYAKADKVLQVYWAGIKYPVLPNFDVTLAYYGYKQNSYATGALAGCSSTVSGSCSGHLNDASIVADYHFTKRWDVYAGVMWSNVSDGLANGYLNTTNVNPTIGGRFTF
jgi:predicted porin